MRRFRSSVLQEDYIIWADMCFLSFSSIVSSLIIHKLIFLLCSIFVYCLFSKSLSFPGFYFSPFSVTGCLPCLCHRAGSLNQTCDKLTGQCICQDASVTGQTCERCKELYFGFDSVTGRWVFLYYRSLKTSLLHFSHSCSFRGFSDNERCALVR